MFEEITFEYSLILVSTIASLVTFLLSIVSRIYRFDVQNELIKQIVYSEFLQTPNREKMSKEKKIQFLYNSIGNLSISTYIKDQSFRYNLDNAILYSWQNEDGEKPKKTK